MASSRSLASGIERVIAAASALSNRHHAAPASTPASSSSAATGIPVHSLHETSPWIMFADPWWGVSKVLKKLLPEHSMKHIRDTIG